MTEYLREGQVERYSSTDEMDLSGIIEALNSMTTEETTPELTITLPFNHGDDNPHVRAVITHHGKTQDGLDYIFGRVRGVSLRREFLPKDDAQVPLTHYVTVYSSGDMVFIPKDEVEQG